MKIIGIVAEYNPFHNGHAHQIKITKETLKPDGIIAVMSGNFVQRGYPALYDKWTRTRLALEGGANLVLELPTFYATSSAEAFAQGAVETLNATGLVTHLSFGSENDNLDEIEAIADLLVDESPDFKAALMTHLDKGLSYPAARQHAITHLLGHEISPLSYKSNAILAIEYIKAIKRTHAAMVPFPVKRVGSDYHDLSLNTHFASATAIRSMIFDQGTTLGLDAYMPHTNATYIQNHDLHAMTMTDFEMMLLYRLQLMSTHDLANIREVAEGIENKIVDVAKGVQTYEELVSNLKSKRFTQTRIQRILLNVLLAIQKEDMPIDYIRVLGFDDTGRKILSQMKESARLPIITTVSKAPESILKDSKLFNLDVKASNLYNLGLPKDKRTVGNPDFLKKPIILGLK